MSLTLVDVKSEKLTNMAFGGAFQDFGTKWEKQPLLISEIQKTSIKNYEKVLEIIGGHFENPTAILNLKVGQLRHPSIKMLDKQFREAELDYKMQLSTATVRDEEWVANTKEKRRWWEFFTDVFASESEENRNKPAETLGVLGVSSTGTGIAVKVAVTAPASVPIAAVAIVAGSALFLVAAIWKRISKNNQIAKEGCAHRIKILQYIGDKEVERLDKMKNLILNRIRCLEGELKILSAQSETNISYIEEIDQLKKINSVFIQNEEKKNV